MQVHTQITLLRYFAISAWAAKIQRIMRDRWGTLARMSMEGKWKAFLVGDEMRLVGDEMHNPTWKNVQLWRDRWNISGRLYYRRNIKVTICIPMGGSLVVPRGIARLGLQRAQANKSSCRIERSQLRGRDGHVSRACTYLRGMSCVGINACTYTSVAGSG